MFLSFKNNIFDFLRNTVKPVLSGHSKGRPKLVFKTNFRLMQVKSIAECWEHSAILSTFIKLPCVIKIFFSIFEWLLKTGFTVIPLECQKVWI